MDMDEDQGTRGATGGEMHDIIKEKEAPGITHGQLSPEPNVKIRLTKCGLTFSGPTAFPSNMNCADFVFEGQPYSSSQQGIQYFNAMHHKVPEIAAKITATHETKIIKDISHDIPKSEEWKKLAPTKLWDLMDAKFTHNPPLMKQLLDT